MNKQFIIQILYGLVLFVTLQNLQIQSLTNSEWNIFTEPESNIENQINYYPNNILIKSKLVKNQTHFESIGSQFAIDEDIQEQINTETKFRQKRAVYEQKNALCVVPKNELNQLKTVIDAVLVNLTHRYEICEYSSLNCTEMAQLIKCGINNIKLEINNNLNKNISSEEYKKINSAYEILNTEYLNIKQNQIYKQQMEKLFKAMQHLEKLLKNMNHLIMRRTVNICAKEIHSGIIEDCFKEFHNLIDDSKLLSITKIVDNVYNSITDKNKDNIILHLLGFIGKITNKCEKFTLYLSLITKMQEYNDMSCYLSHFWNSFKTASGKWNNQIGKITDCPKNYLEFFNSSLDNIIKHIYTNCLPNTENAIQFINEILSNDQKIIAYPILFEEMKKRNGLNGHEIILLGYKIRDLIIVQKSENLTNIKQVKEELPSSVKTLLSAGAIHLKTNYFRRYNFELSIYTTVSICTESVDKNHDWILSPIQDGRYFLILNIATRKYLLAQNNVLRQAESGQSDEYLWEVVPVVNGESVFIRNKKSHQILGSALGDRHEISYALSDCYHIQLFEKYTGDDHQLWRIEAKN